MQRFSKPKNTVRYFLAIVFALFFFFLSNDFGLIDIQKTAIVMAVGIDRQDDTFIVTSQIAIPQPSKQGKQTQTVQIVSRGDTVAQAFEEINAKTGWYPKLAFCRLIILGEKTVQQNAFDALDFFLLDEYISDNCLLATCDETAKELLNVQALIDPSGSVAMQKVLSSHAERVGATLPSTLREFAIGYFSDGKSAYLPILKTQPQQEKIGATASQQEQQNQQGNGKTGNEEKDSPVFSAGETALFLAGKRVGTLTREETFAFSAVKGKLRLATYSVADDDASYSLNIKRNSPKDTLKINGQGNASYEVKLTMTAGLLDYSKALSLESGADAGDIPSAVFRQAEKRLSAQIQSAFDKCKATNCDLFGLLNAYQKKHPRQTPSREEVLQNTHLQLSVRFRNIR